MENLALRHQLFPVRHAIAQTSVRHPTSSRRYYYSVCTYIKDSLNFYRCTCSFPGFSHRSSPSPSPCLILIPPCFLLRTRHRFVSAHLPYLLHDFNHWMLQRMPGGWIFTCPWLARPLLAYLSCVSSAWALSSVYRDVFIFIMFFIIESYCHCI